MRKLITVLLGALMLLTLTSGLANAAAPSAETAKPKVVEPRVAGHRGATGITGYPEETLKAIQYAAKHGAQLVEGDVRFTRDNHAVMMHDEKGDRTTKCKGKISDLTFAQLRKCASAAEVPQPLSWFKEAKRLGLGAILELRTGMTAVQLQGIVNAVNREAPDELVIASFNPTVLDMAKAKIGDRARYAPIIHGRTAAGVESAFGYSVNEHAKKYDLIMPDYKWFTVDRMGWYRDRGVEVWLWTADTDEAIRRCKALAKAAPGSVIIADNVAKVTGK